MALYLQDKILDKMNGLEKEGKGKEEKVRCFICKKTVKEDVTRELDYKKIKVRVCEVHIKF